MILHDPSLAMKFPDYGILIPVLDSRADKIVEHLGSVARERVIAGVAGVEELLGEAPGAFRMGRADVARVHDASFVDRLFSSERDDPRGLESALLSAYELIDSEGKPNRYAPQTATRPLCSLFDTILAQVSGTYAAARIALASIQDLSVGVHPKTFPPSIPGFCYFLGGGMHHARRDAGSGFCLINDIMISIARLRAEGRITRAWVIDVDAHKGDGTAELAARDANTMTLSVHMAVGWPLDSASLEEARRAGRGPDRAPLIPSDVDIPIAKGEDHRYVSALAEGLLKLEHLSSGQKTDIAIVVDGADPYEGDGLPSSADLALPLEECLARDLQIHRFLSDRSIPAAWIMAGGYGERAWEPPYRFLNTLFT